jgi:hypothetical protein
MKTIRQIFCAIAIVFLTTLLNGYTLSILWGWLIVPVFALSALSVVQSIGLSFIMGFFKGVALGKNDDRSFGEIVFTWFVVAIVYYPMIILTGYIIHCAM